jgi:hypothetical protein
MLKQDAVTQIHAGFLYGSLVWRVKTDLPVFLLNCCISRTCILSEVMLYMPHCFLGSIILKEPVETQYFPQWVVPYPSPTNSDVMLSPVKVHQCALLTKKSKQFSLAHERWPSPKNTELYTIPCECGWCQWLLSTISTYAIVFMDDSLFLYKMWFFIAVDYLGNCTTV